MDLVGSLFGRDITIHAFGVNSGTSILNLNDFAVNQSLPVFFGTAGFKLDISSSDNTKDVAAGTGARKVKVYGLDANLRPLIEEVTLNGQTAVTTVGTFRRVFAVAVSLVGTDGVQAGDIYVIKTGSSTWTGGVPNTLTAATVVCKVLIANGSGYSGYWTVPADPVGSQGGEVPKRKGKFMALYPSSAVQNVKLLVQVQGNLDTDNGLITAYETIIAGLTAGSAGYIDMEKLNLDYLAGTDIVLKQVPLVAAGQVAVDLTIRYV
jgi:hypothetical protein